MKNSLMIVVLIGALGLAYRNTLSGTFLYDDKRIIVNNPLVRSSRSLKEYFSTPYWGRQDIAARDGQGGQFRPILILSYRLNYLLNQLDTRGYHAINLALHIGVSLLLYLLALQLGFTNVAAYSASLLFALFPVQTEAVSNIVGRSELLSAFFTLSAWLLLSKAPSRVNIGAGLALFTLALFTKENAAAFFPLLVISDLLLSNKPLNTLLRQRWILWSGTLACLLFYLAGRQMVLGSALGAGGYPYFDGSSPSTVLLTMSKFFCHHYLWPLFSGLSQCADFTRPALADATTQDVGAWIGLGAIVGAGALGILFVRKGHRKVAWCLTLFFLMLLPVSNLFIRTELIGAERFLYFPSIGFALGLGLLGQKLWEANRNVFFVILITLSCWYGTKTYQRNHIWTSEKAFWEATVQDAPQSPRAWNGLGVVRLGEKSYEEAASCFNTAIHLNPMLLDAHYNLALYFFLTGKYTIAERGFTFVLAQKPYDMPTLFHLASIAEFKNAPQQAQKYYQQMLLIDPEDQVALRKLESLKGLKR